MKSKIHPWPEPAWLDGIADPIEKEQELHRLLLGLARLFHSREGTSIKLADTLGVTPNALAQYRIKGKVPPDMAVAIERALGKELLPRVLFHPDLFGE